MERIQEGRAKQLVEQLEEAGLNHGLLMKQGHVVLRGPGSPNSESPTTLFEADLNNAIELGLPQKGSVSGSHSSWEWYVFEAERLM